MKQKAKPGHPHYRTQQWRNVRKLVLLRDNYQCQLHGAKCKGRATSVDHVLARVRGGSDSLRNLVAACDTCNKSKGASLVAPVNTVYW